MNPLAEGAAGYRVDEARLADVAGLAALMVEEARHAQRLAPYFELDADFDWRTLARDKLGASACAVFVARSQAGLLGFLEVRVRGQRSKPTLAGRLVKSLRSRSLKVPSPPRRSPWAVIEGCFVTEPVRRQGVGTAMVEQAIDWAQSHSIRCIELGVLAANRPAIEFWRRHGFSTYRELMIRNSTAS